MKINLLKQSRTIIIPQDRSKAKESNRRIYHNEYYFFADIPVDAAQSVIDSFVDALERIVREDIWDISIIYDYTAAAPDGTEGAVTIRFCTQAVLSDEYTVCC